MLVFGLEKIGFASIRKPYLSCLGLAIAIILALISLPHLKFEDDVLRLFVSSSGVDQSYSNLKKLPDIEGTEVIVLATTESTLLASQFSEIRDIALELELMDGVLSVASPFTMRFPQDHGLWPGEPVLPIDLENAKLKKRLSEYTASSEYPVRSLISNNLQAALIRVSINTAGMERAGIRNRVGDVRSIVGKFTSRNVRYHLTGFDVISFEMAEAVQRDLLFLNSAGAILAFVVSLLVFRSLALTLLALAPACLGVLATLGLFSATGIPITVMSNVVPILVLVLGLADTIHLVMFLATQERSQPLNDRLVQTIRTVGPACALTTLTTAVAFAAIAIADYSSLREFAMMGMAGMIVSFLLIFVSFPLFARFVPSLMVSSPYVMKSMRLQISKQLTPWVFRNTRAIVSISVIVICVMSVGHLLNEPWFSIYENLPEDSDVRKAGETVENRFGGFFRLWGEIEFDQGTVISSIENWKRYTAIHLALERENPDISILSLLTFARWLGKPDKPLTQMDLDHLPIGTSAQFESPNRAARIVMMAGDPMRDQISRRAYDNLEALASKLGVKNLSGIPAVLRHESVKIINQMNFGLIAACLITVFMIALAFRWSALAAVLLVPNLLPLLLTGSALHVINSGYINPTAILALTIAFGIAVDDSIHFLNRFRVERNAGEALDSALRTAIEQTGHVMLITTVLISLGMAVTLVSNFETIRLFGKMMILTLVTALGADLIILPALLRLPWMRACENSQSSSL